MQEGLLLLLLCQLSSYTLVTPTKVCGRPVLGPNIEDIHLQRVYEVGQEVFLSCKTGYAAISGSRKLVCSVSGAWSPSSSRFSCLPKTCSVPGPFLNGEIHIADNVYQSTINYTCNPGYILNGANTSECLHDGTWSHPLPVCDPVTCGLPSIPKYASITYSRKFNGSTTLFGDSVMYECTPPLVLFGNKIGFCTANGNWSEAPQCRLVTCPPPTGILNGFMSFAVHREHGYKEKIMYGCNVNYVLDGPTDVECEATGSWSTKPICRAPCAVGINRGRILYNYNKIWIDQLKPKGIAHSDLLAVYCKNEEKNCGYPVVTQCIDGTLEIPQCFKEPSYNEYTFGYRSLPSEINMC